MRQARAAISMGSRSDPDLMRPERTAAFARDAGIRVLLGKPGA